MLAAMRRLAFAGSLLQASTNKCTQSRRKKRRDSQRFGGHTALDVLPRRADGGGDLHEAILERVATMLSAIHIPTTNNLFGLRGVVARFQAQGFIWADAHFDKVLRRIPKRSKSSSCARVGGAQARSIVREQKQ